MLLNCITAKYILTVDVDCEIGRPGYKNNRQFKPHFVITFEDNYSWIVYSTSSVRSDRVKTHQWEAFNLKEINPSITKAFIVYPDSLDEKEKKEAIRENNKYQTKTDFSYIDAVLSQSEMYKEIENYALKNLSTGKAKDIKGNNFEQNLTNILSFPNNFIKWQTKSDIIEGLQYNIFKDIVEYLNLNPENISEIKATADKKAIGKLPSGGNPKTDVILTVIDKNNTGKHYTISCKRTSENSVSVHEYTADAFSDVLDAQNTELRFLLNSFQEAGSMGAMGEINRIRLTEALKPYITKLTKWVIAGTGGTVSSALQYAKYIITYNDNDMTISIHSTDEYCQKLLSEVKGNFGTPFSWTYPSKRRGARIQLKCKIL